MRIDRIRLRNFRGFEDFAIDLHPSMTVLVGENGAGKTTVIDALAYAVSLSLSRIGINSLAPQPSDVRREKLEIAGIEDLQPQPPMILEWLLRSNDIGYAIQASSDGPNWQSTGGDLASLHKRLNKHVWKHTAAGKLVKVPLVLRIAAERGWRSYIQARDIWQGQRQKGFDNWTSPAANQEQLLTWWRKYTVVELQEGGGAVPQLAAVKQAMLHAIPGVTAVEYRARHEELRLTFDDGRVLAFHELSDGFRNMVATVADIAWRAAVLNPQLEADAAREVEGVVLIDEIDLHLHPRWQREILHTFHRVFPRLQFVVTTHSPQVIASAERDWVRMLDGQTVSIPQHVEGRDSNSLLEDVFHVDVRPSDERKQIEQLFEHIDEEDYTRARTLLDELHQKMGPDDPDLVRARWMLDAEES